MVIEMTLKKTKEPTMNIGLKAMLEDIIDRKRLAYAKHADNRHTSKYAKEVTDRVSAEINAFSAVLDALNDDYYMLCCY